jgi:hypothetical protein
MVLFERLRQVDARFVPGNRTPDPKPDYSSYWRRYRGKRLLMSLTEVCLAYFTLGTTVAIAEWSTGRAYSWSMVLPAIGAALLSVGVMVGWVRYRRERAAGTPNVYSSTGRQADRARAQRRPGASGVADGDTPVMAVLRRRWR